MNRGKLEQLPDSPAASASGDSDKEAKEAFGPPQDWWVLCGMDICSFVWLSCQMEIVEGVHQPDEAGGFSSDPLHKSQ